MGDEIPLHTDQAAADNSRFGSLIACGPHVAGVHACIIPTHFARMGVGALGIESSVRYELPIFADVTYSMNWTVQSLASQRRNWLVALAGDVADLEHGVAIRATAAILLLQKI